jgi:hypothetical protein
MRETESTLDQGLTESCRFGRAAEPGQPRRKLGYLDWLSITGSSVNTPSRAGWLLAQLVSFKAVLVGASNLVIKTGGCGIGAWRTR